VQLNIGEDYPEKIKSLMEELKYAKDKALELDAKLESEEKQIKRQREHLLNLEDNKKDLEL
jgi:hypothetical protein